MNFIAKLFGGSYDDLWKAVIRPPRDEYEEKDLGPEKFNIRGRNYKRTDFSIVNNRNMKLQCSMWEPYDEEREYDRLPCVVYLHGNSSSRAEAAPEAKLLLPMNITLFAFDFAGCGKSEGEYISLGWYERDDVEVVIEHLRKSNKVSTIGLWGRSMGAVTAIMYGDRDPSIAGMVLDSPFSSLKTLVEELVNDKVSLPSFIVNQALSLVKSTVLKKAKFKLDDIEPIPYAKRCFIPSLFVAAKDDNFVKPHHSKILHDSYPGDKNLINIEGDHNSVRPRFFKDSAAIFFHNTLQVEFLKEISDNYARFNYKVNKKEDEGKIENSDNDNINLIEVNPQINKIKDENNISSKNQINLIGDKFNMMDIGLNEEEMFMKIVELSKAEYQKQLNIKKNNENINEQKEQQDINFNDNDEINKERHDEKPFK